MHIRYEITDRVQFVGTVKAGYPLPGTVGTVVEITDKGGAVVRFGKDRIVVPPDDERFKKVTFGHHSHTGNDGASAQTP